MGEGGASVLASRDHPINPAREDARPTNLPFFANDWGFRHLELASLNGLAQRQFQAAMRPSNGPAYQQALKSFRLRGSMTWCSRIFWMGTQRVEPSR
jgi:hypothetical protein